MSAHPDLLAIKRFRELQIRNLLFYQAELAHLEAELRGIEDNDAQQNRDPSDRMDFRWTSCVNRERPAAPKASDPIGIDAKLGDPSASTFKETAGSLYREKVLQVRQTLASYSRSLNRPA